MNMNLQDGNFESRLRNLPAPLAPPSLERALLAAIPARVGSPRHGERLRLALAIGAAIAAGIAVVAMLIPLAAPRRGEPAIAPEVSPAMISAIDQHHDRAKETRICDILPPLPQS